MPIEDLQDLQFLEAVDKAIYRSKLPPKQEEPLRRHLHSFRDDDGHVKRAEVLEALRRVRPALSLWAAGEESNLKDLQEGPIRRHLGVLIEDEEFDWDAELQRLLAEVDPAIAVMAKGAERIIEQKRRESEAEGPTWPAGGL